MKPVRIIELLLKRVTHTVELRVDVSPCAKLMLGVLFVVQFHNFDQTVSFYWSNTLLQAIVVNNE